MNLSALLDFLRRRPAVLVAGGFIVVIVLGLASALRPTGALRRAVLFTNSPPRAATSVERHTVPGVASQPRIAPDPNAPLGQLAIFVSAPAETAEPPLGVHAPAGRLLRCQLVNTVDSANIETPVIALVADDLWHNGELVVPTGTEVHGRARADHLRERIVASGAWTLVWQTGEELVVNGIALDREEHPTGTAWGLTDGSAGLRGQVLRSDAMAEVKLFLATFMSGMASGMQETRPTLLGTEFPGTARNAALSGASSVMNRYAQDLADTVRRDGIYIRVPAGKQMYLYVTETLDRSRARVGASRPRPAASVPVPNPQPQPDSE
jgi:hypothetical protein